MFSRPLKTAIIAAAAMLLPVNAALADVPSMPQGYPIDNLYKSCTPAEASAAGYPDWHFGETARRYLSDGTIQFTNTTNQTVPYTAEIESGTNHEIEANSTAKWPSNGIALLRAKSV